MPKPAAQIKRSDDALLLSGVLSADTVARLRLDPRDALGVAHIGLEGVERVDTVGVALIAQLVGAASDGGRRVTVSGRPSGLEELCMAYRINPDFSDFP